MVSGHAGTERQGRGAGLAGVVVLAAAAALWLAPRPAAGSADPLEHLHERLEGLAPAEQIAYLDSLLSRGVTDARVHFFKGNAFFTAEQYDSAMAEFERAVAIDEDYGKAWVNLGIVLDNKRRHADARRAYERAIAINPEDVLAYCHLGFNYYGAGEHGEAMRCYEKALEIDPESAQAHYNLGLAFANAKIFKEALVEWARVAELDPGGQLGKMAAENVELIRTYLELGD